MSWVCGKSLRLLKKKSRGYRILKIDCVATSVKSPYTNSALKQKIQKQIRETHQYKEEQERVAFLLEKSLKVIMAAIPQLSSIEKQVFYLQRYSGKSLVEISKDLGYDYGYIRRLASQAKKKAEKVSQAQSL